MPRSRGRSFFGWWRMYPLYECARSEDVGGSVTDNRRKSEKEWASCLTPEQFRIAREKGTERAFTGAYWDHHEDGRYVCVACGAPLFDSVAKFDSGTGWPSYSAPVE